MNPADIKSLIDAMAASDVTELEFSENGWTLRLSRGAAAPSAAPTPAPAAALETRSPAASTSRPSTAPTASDDVVAPLSGLLHLRPSPGEPPFAAVGQTVEAGAPLCIVEAMKVFNEVRAERAGTVAAVLADDGDEVEAGQPVMRLA